MKAIWIKIKNLFSSNKSHPTTTFWRWGDFCRETFCGLNDVEEQLEESENMIKYCKSTIMNLIMTTDPKQWGDEEYNGLEKMGNDFRSYFDDLIEAMIDKIDYEDVIDNWDNCHTPEGLAKDDYPEFIEHYSAFVRVND